MPHLIDLVGQRFTRLVVLYRSPQNNSSDKPRWMCRCDCGQTITVSGLLLRDGRTTSCGCRHREQLASFNRSKKFKHGHAEPETRTYKSWRAMINRCYNHKANNYADYGGRGITVAREWRDEFRNFLHDLGERPIGMTLDRIDNDKGYGAGNVRWATPAEQTLNRRNQHVFDINDRPVAMSAIAAHLAIPVSTLRFKLRQAGVLR